MKLKELFAKTQGSRQLRIAGQKEKAMCGRDFWGRYRNTEAWETEVSKVNLIPARATIGSLWFDTVICEIELAAPQGEAQEPKKGEPEPATLGQGMVFRDGCTYFRDGTEETTEEMIRRIVREMFKAWTETAKDGGCIVIGPEEAAQIEREAAQAAPGTMEPPQVNDACQLVRAFVEGRMRVPSGTVLNITLKAGDDGVCMKTTPDKPQEAD